MTLPFLLPPPIEGAIAPYWDGKTFYIGAVETPVLEYSVNNQGWNDDLTFFHEDVAGEHHFIDRASRHDALYHLQKYLHADHPTLLEVGCSSGFMLKELLKTFPHATIVGADVVVDPLRNLAALLPNVPLLRFDLVQCPLPDNSFDGMVMLNVLEHIERDDLALQQAYRILKPGGVLILEVPAGPQLYDIYDKVLKHYRRYVLSELSHLIEKTGFTIRRRSHLGFFLYPGFWLVKKRYRKLLQAPQAIQRQQVQNSIHQSGKSIFLNTIMQTELLLGKFVAYPTGIRCLIACTK